LRVPFEKTTDKEFLLDEWRALVLKEYADADSVRGLSGDEYSIAVLSVLAESVELDAKLRTSAVKKLGETEPERLVDYIERFVKYGEKVDEGYGVDRELVLMSIDSLIASAQSGRIDKGALARRFEGLRKDCSDVVVKRKLGILLDSLKE